MKNPQPVVSRRVPFRVDGQDGPWAVSVAETPHDSTSYSLYIKTPTHNLTLTRTAQEIVELHGKLRDSYPGLRLPTLPIDAAMLPAPPKRKSAFLNTLSRLASPSGNKSSPRQASARQTAASMTSQASGSNPPSGVGSSVSTPLVSPTHEINDPFSEDDFEDMQASLPTTNSTVTGLAAYLTTVANDATIRQARVWKRFVRVRTDDLQSVRVERAIKRVRSDLAAHIGSSSQEVHRSISQVVLNGHDTKSTSNGQIPRTPVDEPLAANGASNDIKEEEDQDTVEAVANDTEVDANGDELPDGELDRAQTPRSPRPSVRTQSLHSDSAADADEAQPDADLEPSIPTGTENGEEANGLATPIAETPVSHVARIPRSQSADPTSRSSRLFSPTPSMPDGASASSQTGDDSSISTTGRRSARKKRSKSTDPNAEKKKSQRKVAIDDFEMMRVLGKGCAGKVLLVRHKPTSDVFALKAITKRHVLAHQELQHTLTEQAVLKRMAAESTDPFVVKLWWSFHDKENLFLVMDFHPGGDLATQLARWGRLGRDRARFYAAEIVEGVEGLHAAGVIYRDLKPENILIGADGHIVLTDFGLSKEFPRKTSAVTAPPTPSGFRGEFMGGSPTPATPHWMKGDKALANGWVPSSANDTTSTFCGTAEYLAPEVIQGLPYSYEVDWWSFGTMLYEMLTGITPFWANNHSDMYLRVLQDELQFPEDRTMDQDTKSLIRGLLQRNPALRMKEPRIKKHPYFSMIDWSHVYYKRYIPPYIPPIDPSNASDTQNFDDTFLDMEPVINDENENDLTDTDQDRHTDTDRTDDDSVATPSQSRSPSVHPVEDDSVDVFDGYSFKGRHSVIIDDEGEDEGDEEDEGDDEDESAGTSSLDNLLPEEDEEAEMVSTTEAVEEVIEEEGPEPKTPEARSTALPAEVAEVATLPEQEEVAMAEVAPQPGEETPAPEPLSDVPEEIAPAPAPAPTPAPAPAPAAPVQEEPKPQSRPIRAPVPRPVSGRPQRGRREKSGIPALDRDLPDAADEDEPATEREEDDEWDFVEANVVEERNGAKGTSLFARGVVDRYKLAVFRKSTPRRNGGRQFSGMSTESDLAGSEPSASESPTASEKHRRGRTPGLTFRKHPRQFLRQKTPPPSTRSSATPKSLTHSASATLSTTSSSGMLSPSPSGNTTLTMSPSLKSKESAISVGSPSESSDNSVNGDARHPGGDTVKGHSVVSIEEEKQKNKVLKKYKEGAEKVLSIFQSPR
ncbi:hypothetical protein CERSUDRAFT_118690 [Gelatoporia subvermispora B]|uniref:Protein kinase domain-containing protein n=1 Tax=Ceriporiopsis subvermispora (strain B) TaxID=914234 RepID=M2PAU9_CERS8|nr:hypothetical protein CERSUDRAFT_118690 [Gelatoporia subvermispora B]